jgi:hypothetical protein
MVGSLLFAVFATNVDAIPGAACYNGRHAAAAKYLACQQKAAGVFAARQDSAQHRAALAKCVEKYNATWPRLQAATAGSGVLCDGPRFFALSGTVLDRLTGLTWEQKTDDMTIHDKDDVYTWSNALFAPANGPAFTTFLAALNGTCFGGWCDWRLPTLMELQTILAQGYPCTASPCLSPTFGPTVSGPHWTDTEVPTNFGAVYSVDFTDGRVDGALGNTALAVRAVRGGL